MTTSRNRYIPSLPSPSGGKVTSGKRVWPTSQTQQQPLDYKGCVRTHCWIYAHRTTDAKGLYNKVT